MNYLRGTYGKPAAAAGGGLGDDTFTDSATDLSGMAGEGAAVASPSFDASGGGFDYSSLGGMTAIDPYSIGECRTAAEDNQ